MLFFGDIFCVAPTKDVKVFRQYIQSPQQCDGPQHF
jgi:hypothetical protein